MDCYIQDSVVSDHVANVNTFICEMQIALKYSS